MSIFHLKRKNLKYEQFLTRLSGEDCLRFAYQDMDDQFKLHCSKISLVVNCLSKEDLLSSFVIRRDTRNLSVDTTTVTPDTRSPNSNIGTRPLDRELCIWYSSFVKGIHEVRMHQERESRASCTRTRTSRVEPLLYVRFSKFKELISPFR